MDKVALLLAWTLWYECRGEVTQGKMAVASVIWNRADVPKGKYDLSWAVLRPKQFSCWNSRSTAGLPEQPEITNEADRLAWADCVLIAESMVNGTFKPIGDWNGYYNPDYCKADLLNAESIGKHIFGRYER